MPSQGQQPKSQATPPAGQPGPWAPSPLVAMLGHLASHLCGCASTASESAWANLFQHFAPLLLQRLSGAQAELESIAVQRPVAAFAIVGALREGLEPFPQLQEISSSLDRILLTQSFAGLGTALESLIQTMLQLPLDQQRDVISVVHASVVERLMQFLPQAAATALAVGAHPGVVCDGCGASPILGPRFKCTTCADYDLCGTCYSRRGELHPEHSFDCREAATCGATQGCAPGWPHGPSPGPAQPGWARGWGKGRGKSWHHHGGPCTWMHEWKGSKGLRKGIGRGFGCFDSSSDSSGTSSTSECQRPGHGKKAKSEFRAAKREWKEACREAKKRWKAERKAAKKAWKQERRAQRERLRASRRAQRHCSPAAEAMEVGQDEAPKQAGQPIAAAPVVAPTPPTQQDLVAALQAMGFSDEELRVQLLAAHGNNIDPVLEQLS